MSEIELNLPRKNDILSAFALFIGVALYLNLES